jgi:hypothetical protein
MRRFLDKETSHFRRKLALYEVGISLILTEFKGSIFTNCSSVSIAQSFKLTTTVFLCDEIIVRSLESPEIFYFRHFILRLLYHFGLAKIFFSGSLLLKRMLSTESLIIAVSLGFVTQQGSSM